MGWFNIGSFLGGGGGATGIENAWGNSLYTASGASASAKQQYKNQLKLQKDAQEFSKWQMANAHQMEVQDLQNAGLNPVLSAGGSGASAGVTEGSANAGSPVIDPISAVGQVISMINTSKQTNNEINKAAAEINNTTRKTTADINNQTNLTNAQIRNLDANTGKTNYDTNVDKENNVNGNTPYPIKMLNSARASAKREINTWKEKGKQPGWTGWKYRMRSRIFRQ